MIESGRREGLLVRTEPLQWAEEISQRIVDVMRVEGDALLLEVDPERGGAINTVLVTRDVKVNELCKETTSAVRLVG